MDPISQPLTVLFVGGPLHGLRSKWIDLPSYYPHQMADRMVPYSRRNLSSFDGVDAVYAPVGMTDSAFAESFSSIRLP